LVLGNSSAKDFLWFLNAGRALLQHPVRLAADARRRLETMSAYQKLLAASTTKNP